MVTQIRKKVPVSGRNRRRGSQNGIAAFALAAVAGLLDGKAADAATYYWDNTAGAGFGTASGTWSGATANWNTDGTGNAAAGGATTTNTNGTTDAVNFGNGATGLGTGTITVGTANSGDITFASGSGAIALDSGTLTLAPATTITVNNAADSISSTLAGAATSLTKTGTGILTLSGTNSYAGVTNINNGKLVIGATNTLLTTGAVTMNSTGSAITPATLDLGNFSQTIASLAVTNGATSSANADTITIGTGKTLTVNGAVTIGRDANASSTFATISGLGTFAVSNSGGTFKLGGADGGTNDNSATLDMSGLSNFTAALGTTGTFRVGDVFTASDNPATGGAATAILAKTSTITAGTLDVGGTTAHGGAGVVQTLKLGDTANTINANTINVGSSLTNAQRASGLIQFNAASGTLNIRSAADTVNGRANMNLVNTSQATGVSPTATVNLTGHSSDLKLGTLTMASRTGTGAGVATATFSFDSGTLDVTSIDLARRTGGAASPNVGTLNIGGGTNSIGSITMATAASGNGATANLNLSGGTTTIGSIAMSNSNGGTANATINLTGSSLTTLGGNITHSTVTGTSNATINLDGGTLDMAGFNIGAANVVTLNAKAGTLKNLGQLNAGGTLTKSTPGTVILDGTNTYTGNTTISAGALQVGAGSTSGTLGSGAVTNDSILAFNRSNNFTVNNAISGTGAVNQLGGGTTTLTGANSYDGTTTITSGTLQVGSGGTVGTLGTGGGVTNNAALAFSRSDNISVGNVISGGGTVSQIGSGTTTLSSANTYAGKSTVSAGVLHISGSIANNGPAGVEITAITSSAGHTTDMSSAPKFTQDVAVAGGNTDNYIGIGSSVTAATTSISGFQSFAEILDGGNSTGTDTGVNMQWRQRASVVGSDERPGSSTPTPIGQYAPTSGLASDVLNLTGMANAGPTASGQTDMFVLQMNYNEGQLAAALGVGTFTGSQEADFAAAGKIQLVWLDPNYNGGLDSASGDELWELATLGNFGAGTQQAGLFQGNIVGPGSGYDPLLHFNLGMWGVDTGDNVVWAVVNHNSQFAVVPEPTSIAVLSLGALGAFASRRRRRLA